MKQKIILKSFLLAGVASLGLAASARADSTTDPAPAVSAVSSGLLGQTYAGLAYSYVHLDTGPVSADRYSFEYNQPINAGFDAVFNYDRTQDGLIAGDRGYGQSFDAALRAFSTAYSWGKPYVEGGIGYERTKFSGLRDDSFAWIAGAGIEFQATTALSITPYIRYTRTDGLPDHNTADYGVKANYWLTKQWAVTGGLSLDDSRNLSYKVGVNVHF
jgi:hypothetical protein